MQIFDGAARYDIKLSHAGTREVQLEGYSGPVSICQARYVPIAGHRALRPSTKFMAENRDISTWLAPVAGTNLMVPVRDLGEDHDRHGRDRSVELQGRSGRDGERRQATEPNKASLQLSLI